MYTSRDIHTYGGSCWCRVVGNVYSSAKLCFLSMHRAFSLNRGRTDHYVRQVGQSVRLHDVRENWFDVLVRLKPDFKNACKRFSPTEIVLNQIY